MNLTNIPSSTHTLKVAVNAAKAAGQFLLDHFHKEKIVNAQYRHTVKLQLDEDSENLIRDILMKNFPDHQILGEEHGFKEDRTSDFLWIVDPIDGTGNYLAGVPHFCVSIACEYQEKPYCAVIFDPVRDELFTVHKNGTFQINGVDQKVSTASEEKFAVMALSYQKKPENLEKVEKIYCKLMHRIGKIRNSGSTALDIAYAAAGRYDCVLSCGIYRWDIAAALQMMEKAGGTIVKNVLDEEHHFYHLYAHNGNYPQLEEIWQEEYF